VPDDLRGWTALDLPDAWQRLAAGQRLLTVDADGGRHVVRRRCSTCVALDAERG
jgi:hypothetical protein